MAEGSLDDVARELYGLPPEEFTGARNARAKAAGDPDLAAAVQGLRKPTTGAWLLNQLVRSHEQEVQQVLALGAELRAAQGTVAADELRALDRQRRQLTHAVAQQARALARDAGRRVSEQVVAEVEETLRSAMVDPDAGAALSSGLLTDTFSATGIEPVDLSGVVALGRAASADAGRPCKAAEGRRTGGRREATAPQGHSEPASDSDHAGREEQARREAARRRALEEARRDLADAEAVAVRASELSEQADEQAQAAVAARARRESQLEEARRRVEELTALVERAADEEATAARAVKDAAAARDAADDAVAALRERVESLAASHGH